MPITRTIMVDDDGSGLTGTIINNAWKQELYNQIDAIGPWVDVAFSAGNFTATGGTWTVTGAQQVAFAYRLDGKLAHVSLNLQGTTIGGTPNVLTVTCPAAIGAWRNQGIQPIALYMSAAAGQVGVAAWSAGATVLSIYRDLAATPFPAGALHLGGTLALPLA